MHIHGKSDVDMHTLERTYFACHEVESNYRKSLAETTDKGNNGLHNRYSVNLKLCIYNVCKIPSYGRAANSQDILVDLTIPRS